MTWLITIHSTGITVTMIHGGMSPQALVSTGATGMVAGAMAITQAGMVAGTHHSIHQILIIIIVIIIIISVTMVTIMLRVMALSTTMLAVRHIVALAVTTSVDTLHTVVAGRVMEAPLHA